MSGSSSTGPGVLFRGPRPGTSGCHPRGSRSHKLQGHDPPHRQQEIVRGWASPAYYRRTRRRTAPRLEPPSCAGLAQPVGSVTCHYFPRVQLAIRATCAPLGARRWDQVPGRIRPGVFDPYSNVPGRLASSRHTVNLVKKQTTTTPPEPGSSCSGGGRNK